MNTLVLVVLGFILGLVYAKGKEHPLREAGKDVVRAGRWVWLMGCACCETVWKPEKRRRTK